MSEAPNLDAITLEMALSHLRTGLKLLTPVEAEAIGRWAAVELEHHVKRLHAVVCPTCRKYQVSDDCPCPKCGPTQEARR